MSPKTDLATLGAAELVHLFRTKQASPVEAARAAIDRIDKFNPVYNAYCFVDRDAALSMAAESEARWIRGAPLSDIDGVSASVKDIILSRGWPTLRGSRSTNLNQAWDDDAPAVARLREAGAVLLGKTTSPEFGWKGVCDSPLTGITRNPWNEKMTSGGSSGGAAVAAAFGMGCLHIGTDGGGSIRIPAGFSGIFGIKPTFGLVPAYPLSMFGTIAHLGPMTTSVDSAARMLTVMARPDERDWFSLPYRKQDFSIELDAGVRSLRIALSTDLGYVRVDPEVETLVEKAAEIFVELGATVVRIDPGFQDPFEIFRAHWFTGAANQRRAIPAEKHSLLDPGFNRIADAGEQIGHMEYIAAVNARANLGHHMSMFHRDFDILLTPTLPIPAFEAGYVAPPGEDQFNWMSWTPFSFPFNLTQQPAASVPCGFTSGGLPVGLQIVATKYRDDLVLKAARAYESIRPIETPDIDGLKMKTF
jgi:aspartyl-tRNA(Asn)/glutamyl-tRNA(Gln) amidotransferase subunit A